MTAPPTWFDQLDLHVGPPDAAMGTRALDPEQWFIGGADLDEQRRTAGALLDERPHDVLLGVDDPAVEASSAALGRAMASHLGLATAPTSLEACRRLVAEDLCLLHPSADGWTLTAGAVCFPSHWYLREKIGRPLDAVHAPVPGYAGGLAARVDRFLGRLAPGAGVWRRNWSIHDDDALFVPERRHIGPPTPTPGDRWLRSEYQTLVRLRDDGAVVFGIRTQQCALESLTVPQRRALGAAVAAWSREMRAYKGAAVDAGLLDWFATSE